MSATAWTPGPWTLEPEHFGLNPEGEHVLSVINGADGLGVIYVSLRPIAERKANARLVSACPDLVEALRYARQTILDLKNSRWSEAEGSDEEWVCGIDAALTKAGAA